VLICRWLGGLNSKVRTSYQGDHALFIGGEALEILEIAQVLSQMADLLETQDANPFRVRAYRNAARFVDSHAVVMRGPRVAPSAPVNRCERCLFVLGIIVNHKS